MYAIKRRALRLLVHRLHDHEAWVGSPTPGWFIRHYLWSYICVISIFLKEKFYVKYSKERSFTESTEEDES